MTLTEFLAARLDEDEAKAKLVSAATYGGTVDVWLPVEHEPNRRSEERIATYDPPHVLAEVDAKRRILALHDLYLVGRESMCTTCGGEGVMEAIDWPCPTLRLLALPYAEHPDYQQEWKP